MSMKNAPRGKTMPKGEARPLGTPKVRKGLFGKLADAVKAVKEPPKIPLDTADQVEVDCQKSSEVQAVPQASGFAEAADQPQEKKKMVLTFKGLSKNGRAAFYSGAASPVRFQLSAFPGKQHPDSIEVVGDVFATAKAAKVKMTKEERAALPKPTLAERIAKREAQLAKDKAKLAAASAL